MQAIVAHSNNLVIGDKGTIPWKCSGDLKFFKKMTMGKSIVVGRKTFEGLPPLPGRTIYVLTRDTTFIAPDGVHVVHNPDELPDDVIVCGGASIYALLLPRCDLVYETIIDTHVDGDTKFDPEWIRLRHCRVLESKDGYTIFRRFNNLFPYGDGDCHLPH